MNNQVWHALVIRPLLIKASVRVSGAATVTLPFFALI